MTDNCYIIIALIILLILLLMCYTSDPIEYFSSKNTYVFNENEHYNYKDVDYVYYPLMANIKFKTLFDDEQ
jgi:hypothetical protein